MNIREHLGDSSRKLADLTAEIVLDHPELFGKLIELAFADDDPYSHRAARVASICAVEHPELFRPYCHRVIRSFRDIPSPGAARGFLKIFTSYPLKWIGRDKSRLMECCFDFLMDDASSKAFKIYSMEILYRLSSEFPEIGKELYSIIEFQMPFAPPSFRSHATQILKKMHRQDFFLPLKDT